MTSLAVTERPSWRVGIALRACAAVIGGYALTTAATSLLAVLLAALWPIQRAEATIIATMLSFVIYAGAVLWVFATRSAWRACAGILALCLLLTGLLTGVLWLHGNGQ